MSKNASTGAQQQEPCSPDSGFKVGNRVIICEVPRKNLKHWIGEEGEITKITDNNLLSVQVGEKEKKILNLVPDWVKPASGSDSKEFPSTTRSAISGRSSKLEQAEVVNQVPFSSVVEDSTQDSAIALPQAPSDPAVAPTRNQTALVVPTQVMMSEAEARQHIETIKSRFDDITALLLDLDDRRGWEALGYKSMHQMIQAELKGHLNRSVSQIYRKLSEAKIRRKLSHACEKIEEIPARQLEPLGKLPPEEWQETWEEINLTAPDGEVTREHVQVVVSRRLQDQKQVANFQEPRQERVLLHPGDWVEVHGFQGNQSWNGLRGPIVEPEDKDGRVAVDLSGASGQSEWKCLRFPMQELIKVPAPPPYNVGQIVMIKCDRDAEQHQRKHDGCWGIVHSVLEFTVIVAVGGELVQYPPKELDWVDAPDNTFRGVCDRVTRLWKVPNLPPSAQHLLRTFYQRELVFTQGDLDLLQAIEELYRNCE